MGSNGAKDVVHSSKKPSCQFCVFWRVNRIGSGYWPFRLGHGMISIRFYFMTLKCGKLGGGGLSPLIERLLWQYLYYDQNYLEPVEYEQTVGVAAEPG